MLSRKHTLLLLLLSLLAVGGYLLAARLTFRTGFPLDDAWIHQTYARNLAQRGEWAFVPRRPSAGSTAPLWSLLLAAGYLPGLGPYLWAYLLGILLLAALAVLGSRGTGVLAPELPRNWRVWGGVLLALEWHMVWAAASGMETLLAAVWMTAGLLWMAAGVRRWGALGVFIGVAVWVRPDGLTLLGPALLTLAAPALRAASRRGGAAWTAAVRQGGLHALRLLGGFALPLAPYLLFNRALAGAWWPNTFYAKQQEYAVLRDLPLLSRLAAEFRLPLVGAGAVLLPGAVYLLARAARTGRWEVLSAGLWFAGYTGLYAWRLPVTYQHGRYLMPAMPIFFLLGLAGLLELAQGASATRWGRVLTRGWLLSLGVVAAMFYLLGGRAYAQDVAVIESEMVEAARWVRLHTPEGSLVAAHDIGALGYFGKRDILDLAGLVSPEVIPFLRDEKRLAAYLDARGADYLLTFPGWYPRLTACGQRVFTAEDGFAPLLGGEHMAVYRWRAPCVTDE